MSPKTDTPTIVVDTREQRAYSFAGAGISTDLRALAAGDYSIAGHEHEVAVERKTLDDFARSVTAGRKRFFRELEKLSTYRGACVVVEATLEDVLEHNYRSGAHPNAVLGAALAITVDLGVPVFFCSSRSLACLFTRLYLTRWYHKLTREQDT